MSENELQIEALRPGTRGLTNLSQQSSRRAERSQVTRQGFITCVGNCGPVYVEYRVSKARSDRDIAEIVHVGKAAGPGLGDDGAPGLSQLEQAVRSKRGKSEYTVFAEDAGDLVK